MNLELKNVGKIKYADIELNGITVIAGENNTGKSTVGKMLFCIFHSFYKIEEQIREERIKSMRKVLPNFYYDKVFIEIDTTVLAKKIINSKELFLTNRSILIKELEEFYISNGEKIQQSVPQAELEKLAEKICVFLKLEDNEIGKTILRKRLQAEFAMNVGNLNSIEDDGKTTVKLTVKNDTIDFEIIKNKEIRINNYIGLTKKIIYIDDPFILDDLDEKGLKITAFTAFEHRADLLNKIVNGKEKDPFAFTIIDEIIAEKKLEKILKIMNNVCSGSLQTEEGINFTYKDENFNGSLDMVNLSTGMKSFVILKQLLQSGIIDEHGMIILDEPEIHLHPEWQLKFAESIVLIQKEFKANILLNTHSPYFLNAIEVYSQKYGIDGKCKYYLAEDQDGNAVISDVTGKTEVLYDKLAQPLQKLENLEYGNGNTI